MTYAVRFTLSDQELLELGDFCGQLVDTDREALENPIGQLIIKTLLSVEESLMKEVAQLALGGVDSTASVEVHVIDMDEVLRSFGRDGL